MKCNNVRTYLAELVLGRLSESRAEAIRSHLRTCHRCQSALEDTEWLIDATNRYPDTLREGHISHRLLLDYHDDPSALTRDTRDALDRHVKECDACRELYETVARLASIDLGTPPAIPTVHEDAPQPSRLVRFFGTYRSRWAAAAAAAAVVLMIVVGRSLIRPPVSDRTPPQLQSIAVWVSPDAAAPEDSIAIDGLRIALHKGLIEASSCGVVGLDHLDDVARRVSQERERELETARVAGASVLLRARGRSADANAVDWQLVDAESGEVISSKEARAENVLEVANRIIRELATLFADECIAAPGPAVKRTQDAITNSPEAYRHYVTGFRARERGRIETALEELKAAVQLDSTFALAYFEMAQCYYSISSQGQDRDVARSYVERAWQFRDRLGAQDRLRVEAWRHRVRQDIAAAVGVYRQILERWPDHRETLSDLAETLWFFWQFGEGGRVAGRALEMYPDDFMLGSIYASGLRATGEMKKALEVCRERARRYPRTAEVWYDLKNQYIAMGMPDSAESALETALSLETDPTAEKRERVSWAVYRGDVTTAIRLTREMLYSEDTPPNSRLGLVGRLGGLYGRLGQSRKALALYDSARTHITSGHKLGQLEAMIDYALMRTGSADRVLEKRRSSPPNLGDIARLEALLFADSIETLRANVDEILKQEALGNGPARQVALRLRAEIAIREGNGAAALASLSELQYMGVPSPTTMDRLLRSARARAYRAAGDLTRAAAELEELLSVYGGHALGHYELGKTYEAMGRYQAAVKEYEVFLAAWVHADEGRPEVQDARSRLADLRARND